jgi:hypothetical protein
MDQINTQRDLGRMEADIDNLKKSIDIMSEDVKAIRQTLDEARGGGKVLLWSVGMIGGGVGAGIVKLLAMVKGGG